MYKKLYEEAYKKKIILIPLILQGVAYLAPESK